LIIHPSVYHQGDEFIALMMDGLRTSETSAYSSETTRAISHKTLIFILHAVRTSNLTDVDIS
jgi:hypothetical protein